MNLCLPAVFLPLLAAPAIGVFGTRAQGALANLALNVIVFGFTVGVFFEPGSGLIHADDLGMIFGALTSFVCMTTALSNLGFVWSGNEVLSLRRWRVYHAMCQVVLGSTLLGLYADNIGLLWVAVEGATIAATVGVSLSRTASALEAAWKYFILGGVGIALALFGTMLVYLAAQPALGPGLAAMSFTALGAHATKLDGSLLTLAFVFLLFGYGTKAALVPLHGWLPDAYAEGPIPLTTALSTLMLNVALIAILRFRHLMQANFAGGGGALQPGVFLLTLGLASLLLTAFSLSRRRDARRFFGFSSIEHSGIAVFAFGIGGPAAIFGGLLHMLVHTLIKSALFQALMRGAALRGSAAPGNYSFSHLRGMIHSNKYLGWLLGGCVFALTGLPPSGLFASEFIIISQTIQRDPYVSLPLGLGLVLCAVAIIRHVGPLVFGHAPPHTKHQKAGVGINLAGLQLALGFGIAFAMPWFLLNALSSVAAALQ
ncbi:proton-conducting transporter membrane subunit [Acidocella sp.]|uniref:proton-conducting transporter transmembrane domain-containing protein n=1 Tax=Acidocella sp. TaxID=50710 RepID=UPI0026159D8C|nr:proton-conducting transporter membrane subunit [Acidocella sp.]MDD2794890.1 proton-conducting transporter membrane subunit [Acidocella sp.]